jgi:acyl-CoA dehydrogenase
MTHEPNDLIDVPKETTELLDGLRRFVESQVLPREEKLGPTLTDPRRLYDDEGRYCPDVLDARREIRMLAAESGFYHMLVPEELGGGGQGAQTLYLVWEDLYYRWGMQHWMAFDCVAHWATGPSQLFLESTPEVRSTIFSELMAGTATMCFALSEPDAGSDVWMMRTTARRDGLGWHITGTKQWMTNGPYAAYALVFAVTDPDKVRARTGGLSAFIVPTDAEGFSVDSLIKLYGHIGSNEAIVSLSDVCVDDANLLGAVDDGLRLALSGTTLGRLYNAARSVGLARWALDAALDYAEARRTFGQPVIEYQGVSFPLAERATELSAARLLGLRAAGLVDRDRPAVKEAAMAKMYSTETATRTIDQAVQTLGGMGLTNEVHLSQAWQELRAVHIADGSAEILRRLIVGRLRRGDRSL